MTRTPSGQFQLLQVFLVWIAANFLGGAIIGHLENNGLQFMATLALSGAVTGTLQWGVFKWAGSRGLRWRLWPLVSSLGWIAGVMLSLGLSPVINLLINDLLRQHGLWEAFWLNLFNRPLWITVMAIAQGSILSFSTQTRARTVGLWLAASWLGAALQGAIGAVLCRAYCQTIPTPLIGVVDGSGWGLYGIVTGLALIWILS